MKDNLDRWIKDAQDEVPDSGEYRRLNRALLKERILTVNPNRSRNHRLLVLAASLLLLIGFSGQISQLGSDSFDTTASTTILPLSGDTVTIHENTFRGGTVNLPEDYSEADIDEFNRNFAAGEGEIDQIFGTSLGGKTDWVKIIRRNINGKVSLTNGPLHDLKSETPDNFVEFMKDHRKDLKTRTKSEPPHGKMQKVVDGILIEFKFWTFEYPGYGEVTRYTGIPVQQ